MYVCLSVSVSLFTQSKALIRLRFFLSRFTTHADL